VNVIGQPCPHRDVLVQRHRTARSLGQLAGRIRRGVAAELAWMKAELDVRAELAILYTQGRMPPHQELGVCGSPGAAAARPGQALTGRPRRRGAHVPEAQDFGSRRNDRRTP
jgi:hypothetical protein